MRITTKGQVTIPAEIRAAAGLLPNTEVAFFYDGEVVQLRPAESGKKHDRGEQVVAHLRDVGRRLGTGTMTTDEIMALTRGD